MTNSGRRPANKDTGKPASSGKSSAQKAGTSSGRKPMPPAGSSARPPAAAARARPRGEQDEGAGDASSFKKAMFFGTLALVVIVIGLFVFRWGDLTAPEPKAQPKVVIDDNDVFVQVKKLRDKADKQFLEAKKLNDNAARTKGIHAAMDTLSQAMDKLNKLSEMPQYQSDDYSANFADLDKMGIDMKRYRDAIHID